MLKKLAFFIFSLGAAASYAAVTDPAGCVERCEMQFENCRESGRTKPYICQITYQRCLAHCNV